MLEEQMVVDKMTVVEGTFYANHINVDSLSPYNKHFKLPIDLHFNKYTDITIDHEDDVIRKKPLMTKMIYNFFSDKLHHENMLRMKKIKNKINKLN